MLLPSAVRSLAGAYRTGLGTCAVASVTCRHVHASRVALAGYLGRKSKHMSDLRCAPRYEAMYWEMERSKQFVHQPKVKTQELLCSLFDRKETGTTMMKRAKLRWFEDDEGVKFLNERLTFFRDYLELDREGVRRVLQGDYRLIQKDFLDVEKDLKPVVRFLRKELEFTNKEVGEMVVRCPTLFRGYLHEMKRVIKYMYHLGISFYNIKKVCYKVPVVFQTDIDVKTPKTLVIIKKCLPGQQRYLKVVKDTFTRKMETKHQRD